MAARDLSRPLPSVEIPLGAALWLIEVVDHDGSRWPWVAAYGTGRPTGCCCAGCAPHEQLGPMPREWKLRAGLGCVGRTRSGRPCRNTIERPGGLCPAHAPRSQAS